MIDIIGHRGASEDAPENTLAAIEEAWKQQADGVEIDVRMSSDGRLVCIHDNNLFRTTGKNGLIENTSLKEIKKLDAGSWRGKEWTNSMIPSLEEVLEKIPEGKQIFIEIKCGIEIINELIKSIKTSKIDLAMVSIISFNKDVLERIKRAIPRITANFLISFDNNRPFDVNLLTSQIEKAGLDGCGVQAHPCLTKHLVDSLKDINKKVHVWTVDQPEQAKLYYKLGLSSITTNTPGKIKSILQTS